MSIRVQAKQWLKQNYPADTSNTLRASKYYPEKDIWFFTFPASYFDSGQSGNLNILLQYENELEKFHYLKVPFSFFRENREKFDIRKTGDKFDLQKGVNRILLYTKKKGSINKQDTQQNKYKFAVLMASSIAT